MGWVHFAALFYTAVGSFESSIFCREYQILFGLEGTERYADVDAEHVPEISQAEKKQKFNWVMDWLRICIN